MTRGITRIEGLLAAVLAAWAIGCHATATRDDLAHENLHSLLWMQTAVEYRALVDEVYGLARYRLDQALADRYWSAALEQSGDFAELPPAVILDVDETALDNTPFGARLLVDNRAFSRELWSEWVRKESAEAMPGAVGFTEYATERGVSVFFITNRGEDLEAHTLRNLAAVGFPVESDGSNLLGIETAVAVPDTASSNAELRSAILDTDKSARRRSVAANHRVLLLVGDDLNDFVSSTGLGPKERDELAAKHVQRFGRSWILLPNPVYGSWVTALAGSDEDLSRNQVLKRIRGWLDIFE